MTNKNNKVPIAILSCFLIAFILQGVLKLSGIFIFEKALDWEIFVIIDKYKWLQVIYYGTMVLITSYCLSFALTTKAYSKRIWHYLLILITSILVTTLRLYVNITFQINILLDIIVYIIVPIIINITTPKQDRVFNKDVCSIVLLITLQISLYFCYLGLEYWSMLINSILPISSMWLPASTSFLIQFDEYIALITFMLSLNYLINYIKERDNMRMPVNIASDEAKAKELQDKKAKKNGKKNGK